MGSRTPSLADKPNTPYFEATLLEITRHCPHLALTVQHQAVEEFEVGGYKIPKETQVNEGNPLEERIGVQHMSETNQILNLIDREAYRAGLYWAATG